MSEFRVRSQSVLGGVEPRLSGGVRISPAAEGFILHIIGKPGGPQLEPLLAKIAGGKDHMVRTAGPAQWYLVGDRPLTDAELASTRDVLAPQAVAIDQSHGRVRIRIEGPMVERLLAKGTAVDVALAAFPVGQSATTLFGHIGCHLTRLGESAFELMVLRGFAESLWDDLVQMSMEYA